MPGIEKLIYKPKSSYASGVVRCRVMPGINVWKSSYIYVSRVTVIKVELCNSATGWHCIIGVNFKT
jgi:hypothetical protein